METPFPSVLVLLATHHGQRWITEQLHSILGQQAVEAHLLVSDDHSTDDTLAALQSCCPNARLLPAAPRVLGNACRNFLYLIETAEIGTCAFVALADQDDVWFKDKLCRAIALLRESGADACSSNVIAFWPEGRERLLDKAEPQRPLDFLFESSGPGCTFVLSRQMFLALQGWVKNNATALQNLKAHDWMIYAFARQNGFKWVIDARPTMRYRQHDRNQTGANIGWRAAWGRLKHVLRGEFRHDVLRLAKIIGNETPVIQALARFGWRDRWRLFCQCRDLRRNRQQAWLLGMMFLCMRKTGS
ncbi:MAG: glycosyltransferase [Zoogloeaceae bacterium]|jgi:rhamnosyltransferase|nr:glycosyltransferase [Zoogloeaceae bacterium]